MDLYNIYRYYAPPSKRRPELIRSGQTLEAAQEWCNDPETAVKGKWFDGYQCI